jgi:hypothetical protein
MNSHARANEIPAMQVAAVLPETLNPLQFGDEM